MVKGKSRKTAWRLSGMSNPEKVFLAKVVELGFDKKYRIVREKSVYPYFIDFAFVNEMVAVEIDGSQHELPERKLRDQEKDKTLIAQGWRVYRVKASQVKKDVGHVVDDVLRFIGTPANTAHFGLEVSKTRREAAQEKADGERQLFGRTILQHQGHEKLRRVERPPYELLLQQTRELGFSATGRKYGVSDNAVRKWIKSYEKYEKSYKS